MAFINQNPVTPQQMEIGVLYFVQSPRSHVGMHPGRSASVSSKGGEKPLPVKTGTGQRRSAYGSYLKS